MMVVGLTGGIATGKSTVTALLRQYGVTVLDCDEIAHAVVRQVSEQRRTSAMLEYGLHHLQNVSAARDAGDTSVL